MGNTASFSVRRSPHRRARRHALVEALEALAIPVTGTLGFGQAEVAAGGLALDAVEAATLRVKNCEGLWKTDGKTREQSVNARLAVDIKRSGHHSIVHVAPGVYTTR